MPTPITVDTPTVIEARNLEKKFRIPVHRINSFKERAVRPFAATEYRELRALRGVSLEVRRGEFFGIVGRNGSGKSTLLKVLASIYRADAGSIRMAGRLAPFIELGVGFDPELTARENVVLNGVMMGLSRREARRRLDAVLDFAELDEFVELKLKNYSSGMIVRLAFSVMVQADADIMLIDEVLAVGDAAFQQKCADTFRRLRDAGKTIVLVSHDMASVEAYCHRAMLIEEGTVSFRGDPAEVAQKYLKLNFEQVGRPAEPRAGHPAFDQDALVVDAWLESDSGERVTSLGQGGPIRFRAVVEAQREIPAPIFGFVFSNADGLNVCGFRQGMATGNGEPDRLRAGERARIVGTIENLLTPGRYYVSCRVSRNHNVGDIALQILGILDFVVFGTAEGLGLVSASAEVEVVPVREAGE